jgi:SNF2 family DNA or RNA helicase
MVLSMLMQLKQICNHPVQYLHQASAETGGNLAGRSGKLERLAELLEELLAAGDRALIFTQFAEMGALLAGFLPQALGATVQFLHGGTPPKQRDKLVRRFQEDAHPPPIFILSLKAGGTGLNLTRANHVFHFDRWWNPAVEDQATDRAFRIGQKQNVQVHKFVVTGTLEEMIDDMIESKKGLAQAVVGRGEGWLTELSTAELHDLVELRSA